MAPSPYKSDLLSSLRGLRERYPVFRPGLPSMPQARAVVDSNAQLQEAGYISKLRDPDARTSLEELVANGTLVAFAPSGSRREVERHLAEHADYLGTARENVAAGWARIQESIEYVDTRAVPLFRQQVAPLRARHANDAKFLRVAYGVDAHFIVTEDRDYDEVRDLLCVRPPELVRLRDWSRRKAESVAPSMLAHVGGATLLGATIDLCKSMPPWMLLGLVAVPPLALWLSPELRSKGGELVQRIADEIAEQMLAAEAAERRAKELRGELLDLVRALRDDP